MSLPLAAALGTALAMRPRRRGTPPRSAAVVQTVKTATTLVTLPWASVILMVLPSPSKAHVVAPLSRSRSVVFRFLASKVERVT